MNIKIGNRSLTYKITEKELDWLLQNNAIEAEIVISAAKLLFTVAYSSEDTDTRLGSTAENSGQHISLFVPRSEFKKLLDIGKDRDGLIYHLKDVEVILQVDVRGDKRSFRNQMPKKKT